MLKAGQSLEIHEPVFQKTNVFRTTVDTVMCHLPLLAKDHIVLLDGVLNIVGSCQDLLAMLLGVGLDATNLCCMSSPLHLGIVHLQKECQKDIKRLSVTLLTRDSNFKILGRSRSAMAVPCLIAWVAWWRRLLGAFQLRTPMRNNDNNEASWIFVRSTTRSHSAPRIIWAHNRSSKYRFGKTSFHITGGEGAWKPMKTS